MMVDIIMMTILSTPEYAESNISPLVEFQMEHVPHFFEQFADRPRRVNLGIRYGTEHQSHFYSNLYWFFFVEAL